MTPMVEEAESAPLAAAKSPVQEEFKVVSPARVVILGSEVVAVIQTSLALLSVVEETLSLKVVKSAAVRNPATVALLVDMAKTPLAGL